MWILSFFLFFALKGAKNGSPYISRGGPYLSLELFWHCWSHFSSSHFLRKSGNLRKWPSSNLLIACILFKIHLIKKKNTFSHSKFCPLNFWWFLSYVPLSIYFTNLELNSDKNTDKILIFVFWLEPWMDHCKNVMCHICRFKILPFNRVLQ